MAYCPKCGTKSPDEARFCNACGTPLPGAAGAGPAPQQPQPSQADKGPQQSSSDQPIQAPFPQQAPPPQGTVRQLPPQQPPLQPPQGMPPGFAPYSQPPKKRRWGIVFVGLLIMLGGFYYIGSAPASQQPSSGQGSAQPATQPRGGDPLPVTPQAPSAPSGGTGQQPGSRNIVGRQAKIAYLEKTDQQVSSIMQGVARGAGPEALNEISQVMEEINQTTLDTDDEDVDALDLLVLEISRLGCACDAIAEPAKKAQALQEESKLRQEFAQKFQAYKQGK